MLNLLFFIISRDMIIKDMERKVQMQRLRLLRHLGKIMVMVTASMIIMDSNNTILVITINTISTININLLLLLLLTQKPINNLLDQLTQHLVVIHHHLHRTLRLPMDLRLTILSPLHHTIKKKQIYSSLSSPPQFLHILLVELYTQFNKMLCLFVYSMFMFVICIFFLLVCVC